MPAALRWLGAVAVGVALFEGLDALAAQMPAAGWLSLASPWIAGAAAAGASGPGVIAALLAAASMVWARIGVDRAIGVLHGVALPPDFGVAVILIFGVSWTGMALAGGAVLTVVRWAVRRRAG
ncbi:MAG TPA: hypothetical protein VJT32_11125 [bacterium]|nr:hypothetical protein [bacterium]